MAENRGSRVMSSRLFSPENRFTLENLLTPVSRGEPDVCIAGLDDRIETAQIVAVGAGRLRRLQRVQDRLVVLVDQHHHPTARAFVQRPDQMGRNAPARYRSEASRAPALPRHPVAPSGSCAGSPPPGSGRGRSRARTTGWRTVQSQWRWMSSPLNSSSLPSNSSPRVSTSRLLPKRRGRGQKVVSAFGHQAADDLPFCRRSSSPPRGSCGKSGCRWAACVYAWTHLAGNPSPRAEATVPARANRWFPSAPGRRHPRRRERATWSRPLSHARQPGRPYCREASRISGVCT